MQEQQKHRSARFFSVLENKLKKIIMNFNKSTL